MPDNCPLHFDLVGSQNCHITIRSPSPEELERGHKTTTSFCIATLEIAPSEKVCRVFEEIDTNQFCPSDPQFIACEYSNAQGLRIKTPGPKSFPDFFQQFSNDLRAQMSDTAQRVTRILRWRTNEPGPPRPFGSIGFSWSFDGTHWYPMPSTLSLLLLGCQGTVNLTDDEKTDIAYSDPSRPLIPTQVGHPFRRNAATDPGFRSREELG